MAYSASECTLTEISLISGSWGRADSRCGRCFLGTLGVYPLSFRLPNLSLAILLVILGVFQKGSWDGNVNGPFPGEPIPVLGPDDGLTGLMLGSSSSRGEVAPPRLSIDH